MLADNTYEGLKCVFNVGNEGGLLFRPRAGQLFICKHCSYTRIRAASDGEEKDEGLKLCGKHLESINDEE